METFEQALTLIKKGMFMASNECKCLLSKQKATIRKVAQVIGYLVAAFSAVQSGQLNYL